MAENDKYSDREGNNFAPVGIVLIVAIAVVLAIFVYARTRDGADTAPPPIDRGLIPATPDSPLAPGSDATGSPGSNG
jgi:FlaG/FlaF family flagellin (archaellin)